MNNLDVFCFVQHDLDVGRSRVYSLDVLRFASARFGFFLSFVKTLGTGRI